MSSLIDGILACSGAGRTQVERTLVALDPLVRNTIHLLAPPPHVTVQLLTLLPHLDLHAVKIQQVFQNLPRNAMISSTSRRGTLV